VTADGKVSPWFAIHRDTTRELRMLSQRLQVGPRSRQMKAPKTQAAGVSYYERMRLEGYDDADPN
jgi:phage terminase small subunit